MNPISQIRTATWADRDALRTLQHAAMRKLARPYYESDVIEAFIENVGTMDDALLDDGTYYVIHVGGMLAACGGWTLRTPGDMVHTVDEAMSPVRPVPTVRSMFVDPAFARRGLARRIMTRVETDLVCGGHARVSLTATLSGLPLYRGLGYRSLEPVVLSMPDDLKFIGIRMEKRLVQAELAALSSAA